ncbi:MAG TPA: threonine/serine dehydratase [Blastocatellia bacterium]|nr:threonine/serine dehydratase [Blastocatellia bacterium]
MAFEISLSDIEQARARISPYVRHTPLVPSATFTRMLGTNIYFKQEVFQKTGAFKVRGAFNKMLTLTEAERRTGVVAVSGGNHAQAVGYAARELGLRALILMPQKTPANYIEATKDYGAEVIITPTVGEAFAEAARYSSEGWCEVHPFNDPLVMAGQGTLGLEILEDLPDLTDVIVSIGGGGLMGGVATAIKSIKPGVRVWGVETDGADCMSRALAAGHVVEMPAITSIAKTLGAPAASEETLALARKYLENVTVVPDQEAIDALRLILERTKIITEPAASCTLAAAERLRSNFSKNSHVVLILCGGNIALSDLCHYTGS